MEKKSGSYGKKVRFNIEVTAKKETSYGKKVDLLISYPKTEQIIKIVNKTLVFLLKTH